jgi:hypothetical protein
LKEEARDRKRAAPERSQASREQERIKAPLQKIKTGQQCGDKQAGKHCDKQGYIQGCIQGCIRGCMQDPCLQETTPCKKNSPQSLSAGCKKPSGRCAAWRHIFKQEPKPKAKSKSQRPKAKILGQAAL